MGRPLVASLLLHAALGLGLLAFALPATVQVEGRGPAVVAATIADATEAVPELADPPLEATLDAWPEPAAEPPLPFADTEPLATWVEPWMPLAFDEVPLDETRVGDWVPESPVAPTRPGARREPRTVPQTVPAAIPAAAPMPRARPPAPTAAGRTVRPIHAPNPPAPTWLGRLRMRHTVLVLLVVEADGAVRSASVHRSSGLAELDAHATGWAQTRWRYPATGSPFRTLVPFHFDP